MSYNETHTFLSIALKTAKSLLIAVYQ